MKYHIVTFGCAANEIDAEKVSRHYLSLGWQNAASPHNADVVIILTCMVRQSAEDRVTGLIRNLAKIKNRRNTMKIILTGCMVGMAAGDRTGKYLRHLQNKYPSVDQFLTIEEVGTNSNQMAVDKDHAYVPISRGCNNYCSYCVVPYARGKEVSRPFQDIVCECERLVSKGVSAISLVGQNVNSYGSDILSGSLRSSQSKGISGEVTYVSYLGKKRIPTLFPLLLDTVCKIPKLKTVDFISSNPWDFSDELIEIIRKNSNIRRVLHIPMQSGSDDILKRMKRWYTKREYLALIRKIQKKIPGIVFSTDIIVGFPGETKKDFRETVDICKRIGFIKAYISMYSDRPMTLAHRTMEDDVAYCEKKRRWQILDDMINKVSLRNGTYQ